MAVGLCLLLSGVGHCVQRTGFVTGSRGSDHRWRVSRRKYVLLAPAHRPPLGRTILSTADIWTIRDASRHRRPFPPSVHFLIWKCMRTLRNPTLECLHHGPPHGPLSVRLSLLLVQLLPYSHCVSVVCRRTSTFGTAKLCRLVMSGLSNPFCVSRWAAELNFSQLLFLFLPCAVLPATTSENAVLSFPSHS